MERGSDGSFIWPDQLPATTSTPATVAATVLAHGTGALNIDGCRTAGAVPIVPQSRFGGSNNNVRTAGRSGELSESHPAGRWPTNVVFSHDPACGSDDEPGGCVDGCPVAALDVQSGVLKSGALKPYVSASGKRGGIMGETVERDHDYTRAGDSGGASRFFPTFRWEAKAPMSERPQVDGIAHPTVKPIALMRWLVRLVTQPGGIVLDPFAGSGTTLQAARAEGMRAVGVEREPTYLRLIAARLDGRDRVGTPPSGLKSLDEPMDLLDLLREDAS